MRRRHSEDFSAGSAARGRRSLGLAALSASLLLLAFSASPASASPIRYYKSQLTQANGTPFTNPWGLAVDGSNNLWVTDPGTDLLSEFDSSGAYLAQNDGTGSWSPSNYVQGLAYGKTADLLYGADSNADDVWGIKASDASYANVDLNNGLGGGCCFLFDAVDNSGGTTDGDIYVGSSLGFNGVIRVDASGAADNFSASASYISANQLTGTPAHSFGSIVGVAVDGAGNVFAVDQDNNEVDEFDSTGAFVQAFTGSFGSLSAVAVDPTTGNVLIGDSGNGVVHEFDSSGHLIGDLDGAATPDGSFNPQALAVDPSGAGKLYLSDADHAVVDVFDLHTVQLAPPPKVSYAAASRQGTTVTLHANVDPNGGGGVTDCHFEYGTDNTYSLGSVPCSPDPAANPPGSNFTIPTDVHADLTGLVAGTKYHYRVVVANAKATKHGADQTYTPPLPKVSYAAASRQGTTVTLHANVDPNGGYDVTGCHFEYGTDNTYGLGSVPCLDSGNATVGTPGSPIVAPTDVHADLTGLSAGTVYHYRIVAATNATEQGADQTYTTPPPPSIDGSFSSNLSATSADLNAQINPQGADTTYHFEYGTSDCSANPCTSLPASDADIGSSSTDQSVSAHLDNLTPHTTYHFRVVATNPWGTTTSDDQTFDFFTPNCPNSQLRQQTGTGYLPECRAYELVSPGYAGGTVVFYPEGPNSPLATHPSRFAFGGVFGAIPGAGDAQDYQGDLYVSTRTDSGWVSHYVGIPANQGSITGRPPLQQGFLQESPVGEYTDLGMDTFLNWDNGDGSLYGADYGSYAPYLWDSNGNSLGRLPTNLSLVPHAADPLVDLNAENIFFGATAPSPDLSHYFFSAGQYQDLSYSPPRPAMAFAPGGLTSAPGSAYDDQIANDTVTIVSKTPAGADIPGETGDPTEFISFPGVSTDGSHVLMSPDTTLICGNPTLCAPLDPNRQIVPRHLYMRVNDAVTYDVSAGHAVNYVGMSADGSKVYFTSDQKLTPDDTDTSTDLYMWSEAGQKAGHPLTLISLGNNGGAGNSDSCSASWTTQCGVTAVQTYHDPGVCCGNLITDNSVGGNGTSDNFIASDNGDIYFHSPEQLIAGKGVQDQQNLYLYRNGQVQYVTTFTGGPYCTAGIYRCSSGPVVRMQVSPDGAHMAFLTADQVTSYDNTATSGICSTNQNGYTTGPRCLEMYTYDPATERVSCVSCLPNGAPPTTDVEASDNGLFMTNDGRVFFSTGDALVPQDTDKLRDVYEYVDGRAQLISSGTSARDTGQSYFNGEELSKAGLSGVSADGTDVYFSTYDTLVGQDRNGNALKFYDARAGGGFSFVPPPAPCAAADECHGAGSSAPPAPQNGTGAGLGGGGNLQTSAPRKRHKRKHHKKHHKRHHARRNRRAAR